MKITRKIAWDEIDHHAWRLAQMLAPKGPYAGILAVTRGGLVPATLVAQWLDIRVIETIAAQSYDGQDQGTLSFMKPPPDGDGEGWLVIDDLADSGATLRAIRDLWPRAHYAVLYVKPLGRSAVDHFVTEVDQALWLAFPWEKD